MQSLARETRVSETAFLLPVSGGFKLNWFAPEGEVDLCGRATLAAAHCLWEQQVLKQDRIARFFTQSGSLTARLTGDRIDLDFPADRRRIALSMNENSVVREALGLVPLWTGRNRRDIVVEVDGEDRVRELRPDLKRMEGLWGRGIAVTSKARPKSGGPDFIVRFFAPKLGIPEDPVTGSAYCSLGPYWSQKLNRKLLKAFQVSDRGGEIRIEVKSRRVLLGGKAITILRGRLSAV